jgi:hypothetical protein
MSLKGGGIGRQRARELPPSHVVLEDHQLPLTYLVESVLKSQMPNVVIGMSGANKTTWILQLLESMHLQRDFFGFKTGPMVKTHYIALDRPAIQLEHKLKMFDLPTDCFTYASLASQLRDINGLDMVLERLIPPDTEHVVIDGIGLVVTRAISQRDVGIVMSDTLRWCEKNKGTATILHHTAKAKVGAGYASPREKALGSGAWVQMAGTAVLLETVNPFDVTDPRRSAHVMDNDALGQTLALKVVDPGRLELDADVVNFTRQELSDLTGDTGTTLTRHIDEWIKCGLFTREKNGCFRGRLPA